MSIFFKKNQQIAYLEELNARLEKEYNQLIAFCDEIRGKRRSFVIDKINSAKLEIELMENGAKPFDEQELRLNPYSYPRIVIKYLADSPQPFSKEQIYKFGVIGEDLEQLARILRGCGEQFSNSACGYHFNQILKEAKNGLDWACDFFSVLGSNFKELVPTCFRFIELKYPSDQEKKIEILESKIKELENTNTLLKTSIESAEKWISKNKDKPPLQKEEAEVILNEYCQEIVQLGKRLASLVERVKMHTDYASGVFLDTFYQSLSAEQGFSPSGIWYSKRPTRDPEQACQLVNAFCEMEALLVKIRKNLASFECLGKFREILGDFWSNLNHVNRCYGLKLLKDYLPERNGLFIRQLSEREIVSFNPYPIDWYEYKLFVEKQKEKRTSTGLKI